MKRRRARNPGAIRAVRVLPEAEVVEHWARLYEGGKHAGDKAWRGQHVGKSERWIEAEIPHELYNADFNDEDANLSDSQRARAQAYAASAGRLPPGMASYRAGSERKQAFVSDGNHRAHASFLRGEETARFYMPEPDYRRLVEGHPDRVASNPRKSRKRR